MGEGVKEALLRIAAALREVLARPRSPARLVVENSAGQRVGCRFEEAGGTLHGMGPVTRPRCTRAAVILVRGLREGEGRMAKANRKKQSAANDIVRALSPRIRPLPSGEGDAESRALIDSIGSSATDNTFDTLARHPNLLRQWMPFTVALAVNGELPPRLRELAILRTGWLCRAEYEWGQHAVLARRVGISDEEIARVKSGPEAKGWTDLEAAVLRAVDELHSDACVTDGTWAVLTADLDERQLIEVPILVGQYHIVSFTLNTLGIQREPGLGGFDD